MTRPVNATSTAELRECLKMGKMYQLRHKATGRVLVGQFDLISVIGYGFIIGTDEYLSIAHTAAEYEIATILPGPVNGDPPLGNMTAWEWDALRAIHMGAGKARQNWNLTYFVRKKHRRTGAELRGVQMGNIHPHVITTLVWRGYLAPEQVPVWEVVSITEHGTAIARMYELMVVQPHADTMAYLAAQAKETGK